MTFATFTEIAAIKPSPRTKEVSGFKFQVSSSSLCVLESRSFQTRSFEIVHQTRNHFADFCNRDINIFKNCGSDVLLVKRNVQLTSHFSGRSFRRCKKMRKFSGSASFKTLRYVRHDRDACAADLVFESKVS